MKVIVKPHTIEIQKEETINEGEYNIQSCKFDFSEEYSGLTKEAVFTVDGETTKVAILNDECTIPAEVLQSKGNVLLGVFGYETDNNKLKLRYSPTAKHFNVAIGSYKEGNDPELPVPTEWERVLELINEAITETNNLNIEVNKEEKTTTITLTKKDGTTKTVQVEDGKSLEFKWRGTELGIRVEGQSQYEYVNLKGEKGDAGAIKMIIVNELPETGSEDTIYLVPLEEPESQENRYAEYVWVNNQWELLGKIGIEVDLTDYYTKTETNTLLNGKQNTIDNNNKLPYSLISGTPTIPSKTSDLTNDSNFVSNTDYATSSKGGVVKVHGNNGVAVDNNGSLTSVSKTYANYVSGMNSMVISKGTLENVIAGKELVNKTYVDGLVGDIESILEELDIGGGI